MRRTSRRNGIRAVCALRQSSRPIHVLQAEVIARHHSPASVVAESAHIRLLQDVDALILVAPAVIAFGFIAPSARGGRAGEFGRKGNAREVSFSQRSVKADLESQAEARK